MGKSELGKRGEDVAVAYLKSRGHRILDRNWTVRRRDGKLLGELDIVAQKGATTIFIEVKSGAFGGTVPPKARGEAFRPEVHVSGGKARTIRIAAQAWLAQHKKLDQAWQIDVITVRFVDGGPPRVRHIPFALSDDS